MKKILIINTGGTFNKIYAPKDGILKINKTSTALEDIAKKWLCEFEIQNILAKDSLDMIEEDREVLSSTIKNASQKYIIVVHGTDTMDMTASYLHEKNLDKRIILTGAMVPYSIDPVEATANIASAYGFLKGIKKRGIYIAMNGQVDTYTKVIKRRKKGRFVSL
jgi:L-asparaginase